MLGCALTGRGMDLSRMIRDHSLCCGPRPGMNPGQRDTMLPGGPANEFGVLPVPTAPANMPVPTPVIAPPTAAVVQPVVPEKVIQPAFKRVVNTDGYQVVGFDQLASFEFAAPAYDTAGANGQPVVKKGDEQIPEPIMALNEKRVAVTGFMLPVKMVEGRVMEFLLVKDQMMCCYGVMPKTNEWIVVKMSRNGLPPSMDVPVSIEGKLKVGEMYDNGYLTGIYLLEGDKQSKTKG